MDRRGFGRLGAWWGSDLYGLEPDLVSTAKGLTSGYVPMSACLISDRVWTVLREGSSQYGPFAHGDQGVGHAGNLQAQGAYENRQDCVCNNSTEAASDQDFSLSTG